MGVSFSESVYLSVKLNHDVVKPYPGSTQPTRSANSLTSYVKFHLSNVGVITMLLVVKLALNLILLLNILTEDIFPSKGTWYQLAPLLMEYQ